MPIKLPFFRSFAILLMGLLLAVWTAQVQAATHTVMNGNDSGAGSLRQAILDAAAGDTIVFNAATHVLLTTPLPIDKSLTIDGGSHTVTISGQSTVQVLDINAATANVTLNRLNIVLGSSATNGGGISNIGTLTLTNSRFTNNEAANDGGAIYSTGTLTITDTEIVENASLGRGGGVYTSGTAAITNSIVSSNGAPNGGGLYNTGALTLTTVNFTSNTAFNDGGGLYNNGGTTTITGNTFTRNSVFVDGGAIYNNGTITIANSTFTENNAFSNDGGGLLNVGTASVTTSTFSDNIAGDDGAAIDNSGNLTVSTSTFTANNANDNGAAITNDGGTVNITNGTFQNNIATDEGGAIYNDDNDAGTATGTMTVTRSTFTNNTATNLSGGAITNKDGSQLTITESTFTGNATADYGGAFMNVNGGIAYVYRSTFNGNTATVNGGAIANYWTSSQLFVYSSTVSGNTAPTGGGVFNDESAVATLANVTITANTATSSGGGIHTGPGTTTALPTTTLNHTLIANQATGTDCAGTNASTGYNLDTDGSCALSNTGDLSAQTIVLPPLALNGGTTQSHAITGTIAQDAGATSCVSLDQRSVTRPQNTNCDIGAYEEKATPTTVSPPSTSFNDTIKGGTESNCWSGNGLYGCVYDNTHGERLATGGNTFSGAFEIEIRGHTFCITLDEGNTPDGYTLNQTVDRYVGATNCFIYNPSTDWDVYRVDFATLPVAQTDPSVANTAPPLATAAPTENTTQNAAANILVTPQPTADWAAYHAQQTATAIAAQPTAVANVAVNDTVIQQQEPVTVAVAAATESSPTLAPDPTAHHVVAAAPTAIPAETAEVSVAVAPTYTAMQIQVPLANVEAAVDVADSSSISRGQWGMLGAFAVGSVTAFGVLGGMALRSIMRREED